MFLRILLLAALFGAADAGAGDVVTHGVASPVSNHCGVVTTANAAGKNLLLAFLSDASGCPAILTVNTTDGTSRCVEVPDPSGSVDYRPMASLLSTGNRYYTAFGGRFYEFDPESGRFTFHCRTSGNIGMGMTEDDRGVIWTGSWPGGQLCSYDPATRKFTDYGKLIDVDWQIYQRYLAADDKGWIYFGVGNVVPQIYAFSPATRELRAVIPDADRPKVAATGEVRRDRNGKVYGWVRARNTPYYELYDGKFTRLDAKPAVREPEIAATTGSQKLMDRNFPDGSKLENIDLLERRLAVVDAAGKRREIAFDYPSMGTYLCAVAALPDGTIRGGAMHPMRMFVYDTRAGKFTEHGNATFQWNAVLADGNRLWIGGYGGGGLLDWDTARPFEPVRNRPDLRRNPRTVGMAEPELHRPSDVQKMPDGRTVVMAGTPGYGRTGGGLAVFDTATDRFEVIPHEQLFGDPAANALVPLDDTRLLIGATTGAGTGGRKAAGNAPMMIYDLARRQVVWRGEPLPDVGQYLDLMKLPDGRILGVADRDRLFLFDAGQRKVTRIIPTEGFGPVAWHQGPRVLLTDGKRSFVLFSQAVAELLPDGTLRKIADVPAGITAGGAVLDGRIYFCSKSLLMSCAY